MLTSAKNFLRHPPSSPDGGEPPITYIYAVATMPQRSQYQRDLRATGARFVAPSELRKHLCDFLRGLDQDTDRDRALALLERPPTPPPAAGDVTAAEQAAVAELAEDLGGAAAPQALPAPVADDGAASDAASSVRLSDDALLAMVRRSAEATYEPYRNARADSAHWWRMACFCAVRLLLRGLEGPAAPAFSAPHGYVDDATLQRLGFERIEEIGIEILKAMALQEDVAKN